jgi:hypothetical protein
MAVGHLLALLLIRQIALSQHVLVLRLPVVAEHVLAVVEPLPVPVLQEQAQPPEGQPPKLATSGQELEIPTRRLVTIKTALLLVMLPFLRARLERALRAQPKHALNVQVAVHGRTSLLLVPTTTPATEVRLSHMLRTASQDSVTCT